MRLTLLCRRKQCQGESAGAHTQAPSRSGNLDHTYAPVGRPTGNAVVERFIRTLKEAVWSAKLAKPVTRIAFGDTDEALVYVEAGRLRVATLPGAPIVPAQPSRFAGWLGNGIAAIEHGASLRAFTLATRTWGPAERSALAPKPLEGAPAWASWVAHAPGDRAVAAEPGKRHELAPDMRGGEPCDPKLRC